MLLYLLSEINTLARPSRYCFIYALGYYLKNNVLVLIENTIDVNTVVNFMPSCWFIAIALSLYHLAVLSPVALGLDIPPWQNGKTFVYFQDKIRFLSQKLNLARFRFLSNCFLNFHKFFVRKGLENNGN